MHKARYKPHIFIALLSGATMAVACGADSSTAPTSVGLAGMSRVGTDTSLSTGGNSGGSATPVNNQPGAFSGTILGSILNPGNDSLTGAPRLAGVTVTLYALAHDAAGNAVPGMQFGQTTTDQAGHFQLPTVSAGQYLVTFVNPSQSAYGNSYTVSPLDGTSTTRPWTVVLPFR